MRLLHHKNGIFITSFEYVTSSNAGCTEYSYYQSLLTSEIALSSEDTDSYVTYEVTIYNSTDETYGFLEAICESYDNEGIIFTLKDTVQGNELEQGTVLESKGYLSFYITFSYKDETLASSNELSSIINFKFTKFYNVTYINIDETDLPTLASGEYDFTADLSDYDVIGVYTEDGVITDYTYESYQLTISDISCDITIISPYYATYNSGSITGYYLTLEEAYTGNSSLESYEIRVMQNVTDSSELTVESGKIIELNTNGCTITKTNYGIANSGTLTVDGDGTISFYSTTCSLNGSNIETGVANLDGNLVISDTILAYTGGTSNSTCIMNYNTTQDTSIVSISNSKITAESSENATGLEFSSNDESLETSIIASIENSEITGNSSGETGYGITISAIINKMNIISGTITGSTYGAYITSAATNGIYLGDSSDSMTTETPKLIGTVGLYTTSEINMYDGILLGTNNPYNDFDKITPLTDYELISDTTTLNDVNYNSAYLKSTKTSVSGETADTGTNYVGYYADIDGDKEVDGIIYADLLFGADDAYDWGWSQYQYDSIEEDSVKEYCILDDTYDGYFGEKEVIAPVDNSTGEDRFYVMALEDLDSDSHTWWYGTTALDSNYDSSYSTRDFGKGKENTGRLIDEWSENTDETKDDGSSTVLWGLDSLIKKYKEGWFVPSKDEWAAFAGNLDISTDADELTSLGLYNTELYKYGTYWSSSQYVATSTSAWNIYLNYGYLGTLPIANVQSVRLSTTY